LIHAQLVQNTPLEEQAESIHGVKEIKNQNANYTAGHTHMKLESMTF